MNCKYCAYEDKNEKEKGKEWIDWESSESWDKDSSEFVIDLED